MALDNAIMAIFSAIMNLIGAIIGISNTILKTIGIPEKIVIAGLCINIYDISAILLLVVFFGAIFRFFGEYSKYIIYIVLFSILLMVISKII